MHRLTAMFLALCCTPAVLLAPQPVQASSGATVTRVVVYRSGATQAFAMRAGGDAGYAADCGNDVVLVFDENVRPERSIRTAELTANFQIDVVVSCKAADLQVATVNYAVASNPAGLMVTVAPAQLDLATAGQPSVQASVVASAAAPGDRVATFRRGTGEFFGGSDERGYYSGAIPGREGVADVTILAEVRPPDVLQNPLPRDRVQEGTQNDVVNFCRARPHDPLCDALRGGTQEEQIRLVNNVSPEATSAIAGSVTTMTVMQLDSLGVRKAELASGRQAGFSSNGFSLVGGDGTLSLAGLAGVLNAGSDDNEEKRTLLGGTRWGAWLNGTIGQAGRRHTAGNTGFDFDNYNLTGGIDYRFADNFYAGAGLGYAHLDSDYRDGQGSLEGRTWWLHGYGVYVLPNEFSIDASLAWSRGSYDQRRSMHAIREIMGIAQGDALGSTVATQASLSIGATWTLRRDAWTFIPQAQYEYMRFDIDGFSEHGCAAGGEGNYCLRYGDQHIITRSLSGGAYVERIFATEKGTFRPYGRVLFHADGGTGAALLDGYLPSGEAIGVIVDKPDRSYGTFELGLGYSRPIGTRTVDFNFGGMLLFGKEHFDYWTLRADVRVPF